MEKDNILFKIEQTARTTLVSFAHSGSDTVKINDVFSLDYCGETFFFKVSKIVILGKSDPLLVDADSYGYYAGRIERKDIDMRKINGLSLCKVTDGDRLKKLKTESAYN